MARSNGDGSGLFGGLAARMTEQVVRGKVSATERLSGHYTSLGMRIQHEFFTLTGNEVKATVGPLWSRMADHPDAPDWLRATGNFVGRGSGQWQTMLAGGAMGAAMGSGILTVITNEMTPVLSGLIAANPNIRLTPEQAAAVEVRGLNWGADLAFEAAGQGINEERYIALKALNTAILSPTEIIELYRRGEVDYQFALSLFHRYGMDGDHAKRYLSLSKTYLSLADAGAMWNRSILTTDQVHDLAVKQGYTVADAEAYMELGGMPPAPQDLYQAYRRGFIDLARLKRGIVQGPIRNEWFDVLEKLSIHPMTPEQAAGAVTEGHMTEERAREIAHAYGLDPDDMSTLIEVAGRPPGIEFAAEARRRGLLTPDQWRTMFLESAIKNRYLPLMEKMLVEIPPQGTVRELLRSGSISVDRAVQLLQFHGLEDDIIHAMVDEATRTKTAATRDLTKTAITELYEEQEITLEQATQMLLDLGYDDQEAAWILALADEARNRTYRNAVIAKVAAGFIRGLLAEGDVVTALDSAGVPPARRQELITLWTLEQTTITKDLTPTQLVAAAKKGFMDPQVALTRLMNQGYAGSDAAILLSLSGVTVTPA